MIFWHLDCLLKNFNSHLKITSLCIALTAYKFHRNPNRYNDQYISYSTKHIAPRQYWILVIQKNFTSQTNFAHPSIFDLHTDDLNPNFQSVKKSVSILRHINVFRITFPPNSQNYSSFKIKSLLLVFTSFIFNLQPAYTIGSMPYYDPPEQ